MNQNDARAFIVALNAIAPYVPPMLMQQITGSPVCRVIEQMANTAPAEQGERPKPHAVS